MNSDFTLEPAPREWWPVDLSDRLADALSAYLDDLDDAPPALDIAALERASRALASAMRAQIHDIIDGAQPSHYCHLINGWGDARVNGERLSDGLGFFAVPTPRGPQMLQFHRDGDFHPWQTLAYAIMAGADIDRPLTGLGVSMRELYLNSVELGAEEGEELGHLLFALAFLGDSIPQTLSIQGRALDLVALMDRAVLAHHDGHFRVCCKVHLSEGICAAAAKIPALAGYRGQAQAFLDGQLDMMLMLALATRERAAAEREGIAVAEGSLSAALLDALARTRTFEDHLFFAGHQIELACLAAGLGYELPEAHRHAMVDLANTTNEMLARYLPRCDFASHFLFYGHYRRALTLLAAMTEAEAGARTWTLDAETLAAFAVDFDTPAPAEPEATPVRMAVGPGAWTVAPHSVARPELDVAASAVAAKLPDAFEVRGYRAHYRTIRPRHWPRSLHYELLDHGDESFSIELHAETARVAALKPIIAAQRPVFEVLFGAAAVFWEPQWFDGGCRLGAELPTELSPTELAERVDALISATHAELDAELCALRREQSPLGLTQPKVFACP